MNGPTLFPEEELEASHEVRSSRILVERVGEDTFPCSSCGRFHFHRPTICYWCREDE